jgi:hypothetical protein
MLRRWAFIAASLAVLTLALWFGPSAIPASTHRAVTIRRLVHPIVIAGDYRLVPPPTGYVPAVSGDHAVAIAREEWASHPSSIVATLVVDPTGEPVWIVALRGVCVPSHGGPAPCNTEMNVVVSARTGAFLFDLSYR